MLRLSSSRSAGANGCRRAKKDSKLPVPRAEEGSTSRMSSSIGDDVHYATTRRKKRKRPLVAWGMPGCEQEEGRWRGGS